MFKIILGLICVMVANVLLGSSIAVLKRIFNKQVFLNGVVKFLFVLFAICLIYLCGYLVPEIIVANINGNQINLINGMDILFISGIIKYGCEDLMKLKDLLKLKMNISEVE